MNISSFHHPFFSGIVSGIHCQLNENMRNEGVVTTLPETIRFYEGYPIGRYIIGKTSYFDGNDNVVDKCLSPILVDFIICFILCDVTRYNVSLWQTICCQNNGFFYVVSKYIESAKRRFPNEILNKLYGEGYIFSSSPIDELYYTK